MQLNINSLLLATAFVFSCGNESGDEPPDDIANTCGGSSLNSSAEFCYAEEIFKKCDGKIYNPLDSFCYDGKAVWGRCGGMELKQTDFCYENRIYAKCNTLEFNPLDFFCTDGKAYAYKKCNGIAYDDKVSFCDTNTAPNKIYDKCGNENNVVYNPLDSFCYYYDSGSKILEKRCNGRAFDPLSSFCFENNIYDRCGNKKNENEIYDPLYGRYNPLDSFCYERNPYRKCGGKEYANDLFCHNDTIYAKCDGEKFVPPIEFCRGNMVDSYKACAGSLYDASKSFCDATDNKIYPLCNTEKYDTKNYFCESNKLYSKCQGESYNPFLKGCFEGELFNVCAADGVLGICVDGTLLRCKQAGGSSEKYIVKPYPGMECKKTEQERGKISGKITHNSKEYNTVQIGKQVWMAENLVISDKELSTWENACSGCSNDQTGPISYIKRRGSCPDGWRIPSSADWDTLVVYAGGPSVAGNMLKSKAGWPTGGNGLDVYGFNAKPVEPNWFIGYVASTLSTLKGKGAVWWSSTTLSVLNDSMAKFWYVTSSDTEANELAYDKGNFEFSVRCLQNIE